MPLPVATTTVTVLRPVSQDPYDVQDASMPEVATVAGHISTGNQGQDERVGGEQSTRELRLHCETCDLRYTDLVRDNTTGVTYFVAWVTPRIGLGLDHVEAGIYISEGAA